MSFRVSANNFLTHLIQIRSHRETMVALKRGYERELESANHIKNQKILWDSFLKLRISLQKGLNIANRLPQPDSHSLFLQSSKDAGIETKFQECASSVQNLLGELVKLQRALATKNKDISVKFDETPVPGLGVDAIWEKKVRLQSPRYNKI